MRKTDAGGVSLLALADKIEYAIRTEGKVTLFQDHGMAVAAALRSAPVRCDGEPVAWRWRYRTSNIWNYMSSDPELIDPEFVTEPVYATPPARSDASESEWNELADRLWKLATAQTIAPSSVYANICREAAYALKSAAANVHEPWPDSRCDAVTGYVLMPREATRPMTMAGCDSLPSCEHVFGHAGEILRNAYRKMVEVGQLPATDEARMGALSDLTATTRVKSHGHRR